MTLHRLGLLLVLCLALGACAAIAPPRTTLQDRLAVFPTEGLPIDKPLIIRWNEHQVPFVEAQTDRDLAFALGLVHAHLRLAQITLMKHVAQGRLSEMAGPFTREIDYALRLLDYGKAAPEVVRRMPPETRELMEAFAAGLNFYQSTVKDLPPEFGLMGLDREPFTVEDLIAIGRLAGTDVSWLTYMALLPQRGGKEWPEVWRRALQAGSGPTVSFDSADQQVLNDILWGATRSGSNSVVVAPSHSASGAALIANDPHLSVNVPNLWLMAGIKSPSFNAVGFMIPGLPVIALGRTPSLAWGGTNMHAANSDIYDVSRLPPDAVKSRDTKIVTRFWPNTTRTIRSTRFGNVMSDSKLVKALKGETLTLRWVGHLPTDEVTSMFAVMRARDAFEFRAALKGFAVSAQNLLCADVHGNICEALATVVPKRKRLPPDLVLDAADPANDWTEYADATGMPFALNPRRGFLASANNRPTQTPWPVGIFFTGDERVRRLQQILSQHDAVTLEDLRALQHDTVSIESQKIEDDLVRMIEADPVARAVDPEFLARLRSFDGNYAAEAPGPVAFETLLYHLVPAVYGYPSAAKVPDSKKGFTVLAINFAHDVEALPPEKRSEVLARSIKRAAFDARRFKTWGDMHRLQIKHWFGMIPVVGGLFEYDNFPVGGSRETVMKTAHGLIHSRSETQYGSQARQISDMGDPDANFYVLLGGNDGWIGSVNALDQIALWRKGDYIRMPLRPRTVAAEFPTVLTLHPKGRK